jgi:hypothetical protein
MEDEMFGHALPILTSRSLDEATKMAATSPALAAFILLPQIQVRCAQLRQVRADLPARRRAAT